MNEAKEKEIEIQINTLADRMNTMMETIEDLQFTIKNQAARIVSLEAAAEESTAGSSRLGNLDNSRASELELRLSNLEYNLGLSIYALKNNWVTDIYHDAESGQFKVEVDSRIFIRQEPKSRTKPEPSYEH